MSVEVFSRSQNLVEEMASRFKVGSKDLSDKLVVFPGKRPGHFLRRAIARRMKSGYLPPRILSYEEFVDVLFHERLGLIKVTIGPLDAAAILHEIHLAARERLGGNHFNDFDSFIPVGLRVFGELEGLVLADLSERELVEKIGGLTYQRLHTLSQYYREFYRVLESRGFVTRSTKMKTVAQNIESVDLSGFGKVFLAGFYALTNVEQVIFRSLAGRENIDLFFQQGPGLQQHLMNLGITVDPVTDDAAPPDLYFYKASDLQGQVAALTGIIKANLDKSGTLDERTAVVLPDAQALFPVLHQAVALLPEDGYNISLGYPISRTPIYGFLNNLLNLVASAHEGTFSTPLYMNFILHPYTKNIRFKNRSEVTRVTFHTLEDVFARRSFGGALKLEDVENDRRVYERAAGALPGVGELELHAHVRWIHDQTVRKFETISTLKEFASKIIEVILFLQDHSTAGFHPLFRSYAEKLLEVSDGIGNSLAAGKTMRGPGGFMSFLRNYIATEHVPFPGTPLRGLQVLGLLETRNLSFDRVYVLDANDDIIPGARDSGTLIPQKLRERLGMETTRDRERLIEYYLQLLLGAAKEVHFFFTETGEKEKSRYLERLLWDREKREPDAANPVQLARYRVHLVNHDPKPITKTQQVVSQLKNFEFSPTSLDTYLKCPLQFYYRYVLNLREKEDVGGEPRQLDVGNLVHRALHRFYGSFVGKKLTKEMMDEKELEHAVRFVFNEQYGRNLSGSLFLVERQVRNKLAEFLREYQIPLLEKEEVELLSVEREISVVKNGHHFAGTLDRVERRGTGVFILDYKIRQDHEPYKVKWSKFDAKDRSTWSDAIGSLQLPIYAMMYGEESGEPIDRITPAYVCLGKNYLDRKLEMGLGETPQETATSSEVLAKVVLELVDEVKDSQTPFEPTNNIEEQCPRCPYKVICGTQWTRERTWGW